MQMDGTHVHKFSMTVDLNVLNHLGIKLYSSIPAVVSEAVANAWDADANNVSIEIGDEFIVIQDDGHGMTEEDLNGKFLTVGYQRRKSGHSRTPSGRLVFGRKGIGKLSLFSIADTIEVVSVKDGQKSGLILNLPDIQSAIEAGGHQYHPSPVSPSTIDIEAGTKITIRNLRKQTHRAPDALRRRLARRFSTIGSNSFDVSVNETPITPSDREYYKTVDYLWAYGELGGEIKDKTNPKEVFVREAPFQGWIGTVNNAGDLLSEDGDNLNDIQIFVRGRVAQEKTLQFFGEDGIYANYVVGEIHADWLDSDDEDDIATTNRQALIEDDPRVEKLKSAIKIELKNIQNKWTELRNKEGTNEALKVPLVQDWFRTLGPDQKSKAQQLFGKINKLKLDQDQKRPLFKYGVLAFEKLKLRDNLSKIENIQDNDIEGYLQAFESHDELESQLYFEISKGRLDIIDHFEDITDENKIERVLQQFLFDHLWLLDPAWDRAATEPVMEAEVKKAVLGDEEFDGAYMEEIGRVDIQYRKSGGEHVIIELKRAGRVCSTVELVVQVDKYRRKMDQLLYGLDRANEPYEIICLVGRDLRDWSEPKGREKSVELLKPLNARVMTYQTLINNARQAYGQYIEASQEASKIFKILNAIDESLFSES